MNSNIRSHMVLPAAFVAMMLGACSQNDDGSAPDLLADAESSAKLSGISWFDGTVDEAFAAARTQGKPIFLYWGAEWCPPCHAIAATVFRSNEFIQRSKLFVPVYLDGDQVNAQAAGERFAVLGYPTMIVFSANGTEVTRIPGGIDIQAYANVLDLAIASTDSVSDLLDRFLDEQRTLDASECKRLTWYSWGQDRQILVDRDPVEVYRSLHDACPAELATERSILFSSYLDEMAAAREASFVEISPEQIEEGVTAYLEIVDNPEFARANVFTIITSGSDIISMLSKPGTPRRADLVDRTRIALDRISVDESVYKRERIYTKLGKIDLERIDDEDAALSDSLREEIIEMVEWADSSTPDIYERQPIINAASGLLDEADMPELAKPMLLAELDRSQQPYYYMLSLADIEQSAGNYPVAIDWLRRAYESSRGPATRFQWGYYYVTGLIEMTPDNTELIHQSTIEVISELEHGAGFHQRPKAQLKRLESKIAEWNSDATHDQTVQQIRDDVLTICARFDDQQKSDSTCRSFLEAV